MDFLQGKKTYIVIGLFAVLFMVGLFLPEGQVVPEWVFGILSAMGLGAIRLAIQHVSGNTRWKTYLAIITVIGVSLATALGAVLPLEVIYTVCAALGVVGIRDAISELSDE